MTQMDAGAALYIYDGEGRRMKRTIGSETTYTFYGRDGIISEFMTTSGVTQASSTDRLTYRTSDHVGTAVLLVASSGMVLENNRTLPYGESWLSDVASINNKKFTTYDRDQESGSDYAMHRYYSGSAGRFVSVDLGSRNISRPATLNLYIYIASDPLNTVDPSGLEAIYESSEVPSGFSAFDRVHLYGLAFADKKDGPWQSPPPVPPEEEVASFIPENGGIGNNSLPSGVTAAGDAADYVCGHSMVQALFRGAAQGALLGAAAGAIFGPGAGLGAAVGAFTGTFRGLAIAEICNAAGVYQRQFRERHGYQ